MMRVGGAAGDKAITAISGGFPGGVVDNAGSHPEGRMPYETALDLDVWGARRVIAALALLVALSAPALGAPCELLASESSTDLTACQGERPEVGHVRHLDIDLAWAGPGVAHRVLDLRLPDNMLLDVRLRELDSKGNPTSAPARVIETLDDSSPYAARHLQSPRLALPIDLAPGRHRIEIDYSMHLDGRLYPLLDVESAWRQRTAFDDMFGGLLWGVLLMSLLVVLMSRVLARGAGAKSYALLVVIHGLGLVQIRGDAFAYLWPDSPHFNQAITPIAVSLVICSHALFATQFLQLRERAPRLFMLHLVAMAAFALDVLLLPPEVAADGAGGLALAYSGLALFTAGRTLRHGARDARLYAVGTSAYVMLTFVLFVVCATGHNPWPRFDHFKLPEVGYLFETTFFSAALLWRVRQVRARQESSQRQQVKDAQALVEAEAARQAANARATRSSLLFASAGHDLSQPLTSVSMALGALTVSESQAPIAEHLHRTIAYAQTLLRDVLAQARGEHVEHDDRFVLGDCIAQVVREHRPGALAKGLALDFVDSRVEVGVSALMLGRILNNLVSNAVRYTNRGRILVGIRRRPGGVELQVMDTGPGLSAGQLVPLQRPFAQGASAAPEGHGLGLFIVRTLCDQAGFRFRVASRPGRGSAFCVWIPTEPA
jgi:signal transduction histidine kinase